MTPAKGLTFVSNRYRTPYAVFTREGSPRRVLAAASASQPSSAVIEVNDPSDGE